MNRISAICLGMCLAIGMTQIARAQTRELATSGELLDGIAALVDGGVVLKSEVNTRLQNVATNFLMQQMQLPPEQRGQLPPVSVLEDSVLDQLILEEIQVQRAEAIGIRVGDDMLNQIVADYATSIGVPLEQLPAVLEEEGQDYQTFREDWRRETMIRQLQRVQVAENISINPRELEQCLARTEASERDNFEYNISHILVGFSPSATADEIDAAEKKARDIVRQLDEGADFAQLAVANSDSLTALEGGALGWRKGGELPTIFADDVRKLDIGEHTTPIRSNGGFHIVRLNDMRGLEPKLVDQIKPRHILLTPNEILDDDATRQRLQGIREQILAGDDFGAVAQAVSEDSETAVRGGDLGWTTLGDYVPEFASVLDNLEIGEISEPFHTQFGWHIAEVTGRRTYDITDDLRQTDCRNQIGNRKLEEEVDIWRRQLREAAYVVKRL
jgi:peptidyl-prolyl cis-trans isomerase SurA